MSDIKTALVSLSDKTHLDVLAKFLIHNEVKVFSTGGTLKALRSLGVEVTPVESLTGFPEVMDGRVKTLHPHVHMALLARLNNNDDAELLNKHDIKPFDLVAVNLYPFEEHVSKDISEDEKTEFIDVGGPSMIRAAAKSFKRILLLTDPNDYSILEQKTFSVDQRRHFAGKAFQLLTNYNAAISDWMLGETKVERLIEPAKQSKSHLGVELRYGENPHQSSKWYYDKDQQGLHQAKILQGKELSFNNLVDLTAAVESLFVIQGSSNKKTVVSVKHNNPCGVGQSDSILTAVKLSLSADPMSVFGSVVACNDEIGSEEALEISKIFVECIVAPSFTDEAKQILGKKKNLRLLEWQQIKEGFCPTQDFKRVSGGVLKQDFDLVSHEQKDWRLVSGNQSDFTEDLKGQCDFANKIVARLKSNAIAVVGPEMSLGLGMGQVNRVDSVKLALERARSFHPEVEKNLILASDAFFPFSDSIEIIADFGVKWILQPGGSVKDEEVIEKAKALGLGMILTGKRHFLH